MTCCRTWRIPVGVSSAGDNSGARTIFRFSPPEVYQYTGGTTETKDVGATLLWAGLVTKYGPPVAIVQVQESDSAVISFSTDVAIATEFQGDLTGSADLTLPIDVTAAFINAEGTPLFTGTMNLATGDISISQAEAWHLNSADTTFAMTFAPEFSFDLVSAASTGTLLSQGSIVAGSQNWVFYWGTGPDVKATIADNQAAGAGPLDIRIPCDDPKGIAVRHISGPYTVVFEFEVHENKCGRCAAAGG